jgi:hypothetical protein
MRACVCARIQITDAKDRHKETHDSRGYEKQDRQHDKEKGRGKDKEKDANRSHSDKDSKDKDRGGTGGTGKDGKSNTMPVKSRIPFDVTNMSYDEYVHRLVS